MPKWPYPALLTTTSRRPKCSAARRTAAKSSSRSVTSSSIGRTLPPYASTSASSVSSLRAVAATRSPRSSAASVHARPKPFDAPVMNQVLLMRCPPVAAASLVPRSPQSYTGLLPGDPHLLVRQERDPAVVGDLAAPREGVCRDVGEAPAPLRLALAAEHDDVAVDLAADEAAHTSHQGVDPRAAPGAERSVVEADRRAVEGQRRLHRAGRATPGHDPHVLHGAASEHPADVQLTECRDGAAVGSDARPGDIPGADELPVQMQPLCVGAGGAVLVQRVDQAVVRHGSRPNLASDGLSRLTGLAANRGVARELVPWRSSARRQRLPRWTGVVVRAGGEHSRGRATLERDDEKITLRRSAGIHVLRGIHELAVVG